MTSAFEENDLLHIKEAIETKMKEEMNCYQVKIPPSEGKLLTLLKTETLLTKMEFWKRNLYMIARGIFLLIHRLMYN